MSWTWRRNAYLYGRNDIDSEEFAETEGLTPPEQGDPEFYDPWVLVGKFGVGKVSGAGDSPARSS